MFRYTEVQLKGQCCQTTGGQGLVVQYSATLLPSHTSTPEYLTRMACINQCLCVATHVHGHVCVRTECGGLVQTEVPQSR